jgi:hypothetical protein
MKLVVTCGVDMEYCSHFVILLALTYTCVHMALASVKYVNGGAYFIRVQTTKIYNLKSNHED